MAGGARNSGVTAAPALSGRFAFWLIASGIVAVLSMLIYFGTAFWRGWSFAPDGSTFGTFGDYVGGVVGTIGGVVSAVLAYRALAIAVRQNEEVARFALLSETAKSIERLAADLVGRMTFEQPAKMWFPASGLEESAVMTLVTAVGFKILRPDDVPSPYALRVARNASLLAAQLADSLQEYDDLARRRTRFADGFRETHAKYVHSLYTFGFAPQELEDAFKVQPGPVTGVVRRFLQANQPDV